MIQSSTLWRLYRIVVTLITLSCKHTSSYFNYTFRIILWYCLNVIQTIFFILLTLKVDSSFDRWFKVVIHSCSRNVDHYRRKSSNFNRVKTFAYPLRSKRESQDCLHVLILRCIGTTFM